SGRMLHWVNYRLGTPVPSTAVSVSMPPGKTVRSVEVISPDGNTSGKVKFTMEKNRVRFQLPALEVYNVALISY
ncbi:MAG: hypothetical protein KJZ78_18825, partial [Bryobacteraceae bacterium]|nr:hypothetical protein [Bryobacteraceae bacterium]